MAQRLDLSSRGTIRSDDFADFGSSDGFVGFLNLVWIETKNKFMLNAN
jgi:hypothetical protein